MQGKSGQAILQARVGAILARKHPDLQRYFNHVWPLFWPWLVWNLVRVARWHARTGREALMAVDCFGNIELVCLADAPPPDDLYTYEAPRIAALGTSCPWQRCAGLCARYVRRSPS
jgi:hypothetical protein